MYTFRGSLVDNRSYGCLSQLSTLVNDRTEEVKNNRV